MIDAPAKRPAKPTLLLTVLRRAQVGPHLVRLIFGGYGAREFQDNGHTDKYLKLLFVDPALGLSAPRTIRDWQTTLATRVPVIKRTYTVRSFNAVAGEVTMDFVVHGDAGIAAPWAAQAKPGDVIAAVGPGGGYSPRPEAAWHLLAGDATALPAIAAALEALPSTACGVAHLEVHDPADQLELSAPRGVELRWMVTDPEDTAALASAVELGPWAVDGTDPAPNGTPQPGAIQVFAHGERESIKVVRKVLRQRGISRSDISISGYWAKGRTEDVFQAEKREPIGNIDD